MRAERRARLAAEDPNSLRGRVLHVPGSAPSLGRHGNLEEANPLEHEEVIPVPTREVIDLLPPIEPAPEEQTAPPDDQTDPPLRTEERPIPSYKAINPPPPEMPEDAEDEPMRRSPSFVGRIADLIFRRKP